MHEKTGSWGQVVLLCRFAVSCLLLVSSQFAGAQATMRPFSADQVKTMGKRTTAGKVYASEKAVRVESQDDKGKQSITIVRLDRKAMWVLMPAQKMYMDMDMGSFGPVASEWTASAEGAKVQRELLGTEQVGASHCDKYRVHTTYEGHVYESIEWDAKELDGFPITRQGEKGDWSTEYQNVHLGPQDPSLFEIPAGYEKMSLGGMFKPQS